MAQGQWKEAGFVVVNGHRLPVHARASDRWQSEWGVIELWHAVKSDVPLSLKVDPDQKRLLRFLATACSPSHSRGLIPYT